jgi:Flp pilus assembly protein TadD
VSVILDALRRSRGGKAAPADAGRTAPSAPPPGGRPIPAGLRGGAAPSVRRAGIRWKLLAPIIVIVLGVWAIAQMSLNLMKQQASQPAAVGGPAKPAATKADVATAVLGELAPGLQLPKETDFSQLPPRPSDVLKGAAVAAPAAATPEAAAATGVVPVPAKPAASSTTPAPNAASRRAPEAVAVNAAPTGPVAVASNRVAPRPLPLPPPAAAPPAAAPPATGVTAPPAARQDHFELGKNAQAVGNFQSAQMHYLNAIAADDSHLGARNNLAMMYAARGMTADAVDYLRQAIRIDSQYLTARSNLAVVLMNAGRLEEAKAQLRDALEIAPRHVGLLVNLALAQIKDGQNDLARETLIKAVGIDPTHAEAHYNLGALYDQAGSIAKAHEHYGKYLNNASADQGERLDAVRRRMNEIAPRLVGNR